MFTYGDTNNGVTKKKKKKKGKKQTNKNNNNNKNNKQTLHKQQKHFFYFENASFSTRCIAILILLHFIQRFFHIPVISLKGFFLWFLFFASYRKYWMYDVQTGKKNSFVVEYIDRQTEIALVRLHKGAVWHYENTPIQIYWKFYHQNMKNFR